MDEIVASLEPLIKERRIVMIGEWHGTNEFPALVKLLVDQAVAVGLSVVVGLEVPCSEQPAIDALDGPQSRVDGPWWHRSSEFGDGRSSRAMAELICTLSSRETVTTVAMDGPWVAPGSAIAMELLHLVEAPRDETMARHLLDAIDRQRQPFTVVLAGSEHTKVGVDRNGQPTLGRYITRWHSGAVTLLGRAAGGEAWGLRRTLGAQGPVESGPFPVPDDAQLQPGAQWTDRVGTDGHHGYVHIGNVTPSPPIYCDDDHRENRATDEGDPT